MQLGWVDFSKEDRQKVYDVMNLLQEQGAVDELGIGVIRDAFANYFFPGTSTIQTRAKYFLIVPYILKEVADGRYGKSVGKVLSAIEKEEKQCGILLLDADSSADGIIGKRVLPKGWVARKPSDIYWNGIRTYGIFKDRNLSISEYVNAVLKLQAQKNTRKIGNRGDATEDSEKDDRDAGDTLHFQFWNLPTYHSDWRENLSIDLTEEEASYLKTQIEKTTQGTLLDYILRNNIDVNEYTSFETLVEDLNSSVGEELSYMMQLACDFNHVVYMARVRYNVILSEGENSEAMEEWDWLKEDLVRGASVDLKEVFDRLMIRNSKTFVFLSMLQEYFQAKNIEKADAWIRKQEIQLKGINRAKLNRPGEFDPSKWVGGRWLDYRFFNARRIINDIYSGGGNSHV